MELYTNLPGSGQLKNIRIDKISKKITSIANQLLGYLHSNKISF